MSTKGLPHNLETERSLLGGLLLDASQIGEAREKLKPADFHRPWHQKLFEVLGQMSDAGIPPDPTTVLDELERRQLTEACGGAAYVLALPGACPSVENVEKYAELVKKHALRRNLQLAAEQIIEDVQKGEKETTDLLSESERLIFEIAQLSGPRDWHAISVVLDEQLMEIQKRAERPGDVTGVPTGFVDLDKKLAGLQKTDLVVLAARPAMGKCLAAETPIVLGDGSVATIEEVVRGRRGPIVTLADDWRFAPAEPSAFVDDGIKPVFRVTTRSGRVVETTITHPFRTFEGWRPLGELSVGDAIAVPRRLGVFGTEAMPRHEVTLLAYLLGDGCLVDSNPEFTNTNPRLLDEFREAVAAFGGLAVREERVGGRAPTLLVRADREERGSSRETFAAAVRDGLAASGRTGRAVAAAVGVSPASDTHWATGESVPDEATLARLAEALHVDVSALPVEGARGRVPNALVRWLHAHGLWGKGAREKRVPPAVFRLRRPDLAHFLNRLFATDGWATVLASRQPQIGFASASEGLVRDVAHLLLRFGIVGSVKRRSVTTGGRAFAAWQLDVTSADSLRVFVDGIGIFGKEEATARVGAALAARGSHAGRDVFPAAVWARLEARKGGERWSALARRAGIGSLKPGRQGLGRDRVARLALALGDPELRNLAAGDVFFDEIVAIEPLGAKQVYDLTVPGTHNFVAADVCVHNTAFVLNIALNAAQRGDVAVGIFSLEMSRNQLVQRMLCSQARVDAGKVRTGHLDPHEDWRALVEAAEVLHGLPILIDDTPGLTITQLRSKARRLKAEYPNLGLLVIDYLQLMQGTGGAKESRENVISTISRGMKILAKELEVPVVALSQLNRGLESRTDKRPLPSDLRESGAIEQDADVILFIYRDEVYNPDSPEKGVAEIIIAKQRSGPIGTVKLAFVGKYVLFQNLAAQQDAPDGYF